MLLTRNRHTGAQAQSNNNGSSSSPNNSNELPTHQSSPSGKQQLQQPQKASDKYSKNVKSNSSFASRLQFWCWMFCGVISAFLSIEYSMRSFSPGTTDQFGITTMSASGTSGIHNNHNMNGMTMDSILMPTVLSRTLDNDYSFDNTAHIPTDPQQHAILIPYRDRPFHLELFLEYMGPYLHTHFPQAQFTLWVIEQDDPDLFNRAWLANVGLREIVKQAPETSCVIFHDVDLVPNMTSHVPYTTCQYPVQLGSELQHFNWTVPYPAYCGGITTMSLKHWQLINGLGNDFIGWGGEDDDLYHRLRQNGLLRQSEKKDDAPTPRRPPKGHGVFRTISQKAEHHEQKKTHNQYWKTLELLKEMHENSDRWKFDGMSDAYYTITDTKRSAPGVGFSKYVHLKAIPQKMRDGKVVYHQTAEGVDEGIPLAPLEFVHVPFTGGQAVTKAASNAGIVWGACHYGHFQEWNCPAQGSADFQYAPMQFRASYHQAQRPWHIPLMRFSENPMEGTKRFTIVRHPYSRAISFYRYSYDLQHGHAHGFKYHEMVDNKNYPPLALANYLRDREHPAKLNAFLQDFLIRAHHPHTSDAVELIPQVQFVYNRGLKYVHHVLHYEFLQRDFKNMLEKYQLTGIIDLPPPDRKRKRKKTLVKTYDEKQIPKATWTYSSLLQPLYDYLGIADPEPPVVDMSIAEIEDEYLLGAQDLANETIAMLNSHFELDFRKFHYAKIKVNVTSDQYWSPIQVIPRESGVAKQQADRNAQLNNAKGGAPAAQAQAPKKTPLTQAPKMTRVHSFKKDPQRLSRAEALQTERLQQLAAVLKNKVKKANEGGQEDGSKKDGEEQEQERGVAYQAYQANGNDASFVERKANLVKRLTAKQAKENEAPDDYLATALPKRSMRQIAEDYRKKVEVADYAAD